MTTITVTAEDIAQGVREDPERCALARAFQRVGLSARISAECDGWWADFSDANGDDDGVKLPPCAVTFAQAFDCSEPVEPFAFEVDA